MRDLPSLDPAPCQAPNLWDEPPTDPAHEDHPTDNPPPCRWVQSGPEFHMLADGGTDIASGATKLLNVRLHRLCILKRVTTEGPTTGLLIKDVRIGIERLTAGPLPASFYAGGVDLAGTEKSIIWPGMDVIINAENQCSAAMDLQVVLSFQPMELA